jgi:DNA-binding PadR family transcriptional regulator
MRALRTPVTMAVLGLLRERPRHPYEMQALLRERHVGAVVRLRGGSLYDAIARLVRSGHVEPVGTDRQGARPERTVYALTAAGDTLLDSLVREYVGSVAEEFPVFAAGLAHLPHLDRAQAAVLLAARADELAAWWDATSAAVAGARAAGLPRIVLLETEYALRTRRVEIDWLRALVRDIETGELPWISIDEEE